MSPVGARQILLVEDNLGDVRLTEEGFREAQVEVHMDVTESVDDALAYLRREGRWRRAARPDLILLDLNLPKRNGKELLTEIKGDPKFRNIPVVVVTSSKSDEDVESCYRLQASCCIHKPVEFDEFVEVIRGIDDFWLKRVVFPPRPA